MKTTEKYSQFDIAELDRDFDISSKNRQNRNYVTPSNDSKNQGNNINKLENNYSHGQIIHGYS